LEDVRGSYFGFSRSSGLLIIFVFLSFPVYTQTPAPLWFLDQNTAYPPGAYIAATGGGRTRAAAEDQAVANLSMYFNTNVDARNEMLVEYNETVINGRADFREKTSAVQAAVISSQTEFLGVQFAPVYRDGEGNHHALAYIDRAAVIGVYDAKIQFNLSLINDLLNAAEKGNHPLPALGKLKRARSVSRINEEYLTMISVINPRAAGQYTDPVQGAARRIENLMASYRPRLSARVVCGREYARIGRKLGELLQGQGFTITERNPAYVCTVTVDTSEEITPAYKFVRPAVAVDITLDTDKSVLFSYNRSLSRAGWNSLEGAYNRAYLDIEKDLSDHFAKELNAAFGY
jgi:hypothetical protein